MSGDARSTVTQEMSGPALVWDEVFSTQPWGKYPSEDLIRFVARNFYRVPQRKEVTVLELGCGPGANLWYLAREGFSFVGVDVSPTAIKLASDRLSHEIPDWRARGTLHVGNVQRVPLADATVDAVVDHEAVYCNDFADSVAIYAEARRVLRPNGRLFVRTFANGCWGESTGKKVGPNSWECSEGPLAGKGFARFTSKADLPELLRGFEVQSIEMITRTHMQGTHEIREWIVEAIKLP
jgi:SAM-dependent methyltransferase